MAERVIPYANEIGAKFYKPRSLIEENWMRNNERWLHQQMKEGKEIIDIGIDPKRQYRSPFYEMERKTLKEAGYPVIKVSRP